MKKEYIRTCFDYIHQNPVDANLVSKPEEWKFSSFKDYCGIINGTLINKDLSIKILNIEQDSFEFYKMHEYNEEDLKNIF